MTPPDPGWGVCAGCGVDCLAIGEHYWLTAEVWAAATGLLPAEGMPCAAGGWLCVACLEGRLGRRLIPSDFALPLPDTAVPPSARLLDRAGLPGRHEPAGTPHDQAEQDAYRRAFSAGGASRPLPERDAAGREAVLAARGAGRRPT